MRKKQNDPDAVRIRSIQVPSAVYNGSQVTLVCKFDLQGDQVSRYDTYSHIITGLIIIEELNSLGVHTLISLALFL